MDTEKTIRDGVKLVTSGSVQMMLGGIVAAVVPKQVSVAYKVAAAIGSAVVAGFAGEKMDEFIDRQIDEIKEAVNTVKSIFAKPETKNEENTENEGAGA